MKKMKLFTFLLFSFSSAFAFLPPSSTLIERDQEKVQESELLIIDDSLKSFVNEHECQVVVKDFKTNKIASYSSLIHPSQSDIIDISYPYFEQMKRRCCCPKGSCLDLSKTDISKGYVFFTSKGIIDVEIAKKYYQLQQGES
jgi:hypothetical protein